MGRQARIEYEGAVYHVMSRGNHQQPIYRSDEDCALFLRTLAEACGRCGWRIHAYVLMGNHYHLLLETPEANLVAGMRWLQGTYTKRFSALHKERGHLFQGRYKALMVDAQEEGYFATLSNYIHLNPVRIKGYDFSTRLEKLPWSSYPAYLNPALRPDWLEVDRVLGSLHFKDAKPGRQQYENYIEQRIAEAAQSESPWETDGQWRTIRRGWYLGGKEFRAELIDRMGQVIEGKKRVSFRGDSIRLHDQTEAERLVLAHLSVFGLSENDLATLRKGDARKKVIAWSVRRKTSVSNEWISRRLCMGRASNLSRYVADVAAAQKGELYDLKTTI